MSVPRAIHVHRFREMWECWACSSLVALVRLCPHIFACTSKIEGECKNGTSWCLHPQRMSQLIPGPSGRCFKVSKWVSFTCNPVTSQISIFVLVPGMSKSACEPLIGNISDSHSPPVSPDISLFDFQSQCFGGLISLVQILRVGVLDMGHKPLTSQGETPDLWDPSLLCMGCCVLCGEWSFWWDCISASPSFLRVASLSFIMERAVQLGFCSLLEGIIPFVAIDLVSVGEVEFSHGLPWPPSSGSRFSPTGLEAGAFTWNSLEFSEYLEFTVCYQLTHCMVQIHSS